MSSFCELLSRVEDSELRDELKRAHKRECAFVPQTVRDVVSAAESVAVRSVSTVEGVLRGALGMMVRHDSDAIDAMEYALRHIWGSERYLIGQMANQMIEPPRRFSSLVDIMEAAGQPYEVVILEPNGARYQYREVATRRDGPIGWRWVQVAPGVRPHIRIEDL
jgi:hypothetical protein